MSLDRIDTVDAIGIENDTDCAVFTIADSWDWNDEHAHLVALQAKFNAYFDFIGSGQILESYPAAHGRQLIVEGVFRFPPPDVAIELLAKASHVASELDVQVRHRTFRGTAEADCS